MYGDVLRVSVYEHGPKIHDKTIINEIAGLITDKSDFIQYLIATGYGSIIQEGVYSIDKGASYEVICKTISRK